MHRFVLFTVCSIWLSFAACQDSLTPSVLEYSVSTVPRGELPRLLNDKVVYHYMLTDVKPESLITVLLQQNIPLVEAWLPLDNLCLDPIGARFTVLLSSNDIRIKDFGFHEGQGRLGCSTSLRHFTIQK